MFLLIIRLYVFLTVFMILQMHVYCISKWIIKTILLFVMHMFLEVTYWESAMYFIYIYSVAMWRSVANNSNMIMVDNMNCFERFNAKVH